MNTRHFHAFCFSLALSSVLVTSGPLLAQAPGDSTALTIYSTAAPGAIPPELYRPVAGGDMRDIQYAAVIPGYAIVKQERPFKLGEGRSTIRFTDVAALIDPTTVSFAS